MKTLLFIHISSGVCFSQKVKENYITYYNYANEGEFYFYENEYDSAVIYFEQAFEFASEPASYHIEKYSRALWMVGNRENSIIQLQKNYHFLTVDTTWFRDLTPEEINKIYETRKKLKLENDNRRSLYRLFIDSLADIDSEYRNKYLNDSTKKYLIWEQDSLNRRALIEFTKKNGFPGGKNNWGHNANLIMTHAPQEWFVENYTLLISEVKKGNLEPWMLAAGIDREFAVEIGKDKISPFDRYNLSRKNIINPFLMFQNCLRMGVSPYYSHNYRISKPIQTTHFVYYKKNKQYYNTTVMYTHNISHRCTTPKN